MTHPEHLVYLRCFSRETYAMHIPRDTARAMEHEGLIEWVPPVLGTCWAITEKGRKAVRQANQTTVNVHDRRHLWIGSWETDAFDINALTDADIGRTVIYFPGAGYPEAGTLTSWRLGLVFVRFTRGDTAAACKPSDLKFGIKPLDGDPNR